MQYICNVYIYTHSFIHVYIYIYILSSLFLFFWLSWTAVQRETQVRGTHEQCRMEKKNIHTYTYLHYTIMCIYIYIVCMR